MSNAELGANIVGKALNTDNNFILNTFYIGQGDIMNKRLKKIRKILGLSQEAFGKKIGVTKTAISRAETGLNNISDMTIKSICREYGINEEWLRNGNGNMYPDTSRAELAAKIVGNALNTENDFILNTFIALGQLTPKEWQTIQNFIDSIKKDK